MGGGRKTTQTGEGAESSETEGTQAQGNEFTQLMKWMVERDDRRREEDRVRDEAMMKMVETISRQQIETTRGIQNTEQVREEARQEELRITRERQEREHNMWEERLRNEREDREIWRKQLEGERGRKSGVYGSYGSEDDGSMMRYMGQPKLQRLSESDDIEHFLTTFERLAQAYNWPPDMWVLNLAPLLTGKAQSAYASMDKERAREYQPVKEAILKRYDINEETYRQRFRKTVKKEEESYAELGVRLTDMFNKWTGADKEIRTKQEIAEIIVMEQLTECMPNGLRIWLKERKPKTVNEIGELADDYVAARKSAKDVPRRCHSCKKLGHIAAECISSASAEQKQIKITNGQTMTYNQGRGNPQPRCYRCNKLGHISTRCPENKGSQQQQQQHHQPQLRHGNVNFTTPKSLMERQTEEQEKDPVEYRVQGKIEGKNVELLLDTGCSKSLIQASLVPSEKILEGEKVTMQCAHGDVKTYPTASVEVEIDGKIYTLKAAVAENLPRHALLGRDVKDLIKMIIKEDQKHVQQALEVTTRNQKRNQEKEEAIQLTKEMTSKATPKSLGDLFDFEEDIFIGKGKAKKSRRERKKLKKQHKIELELKNEDLSWKGDEKGKSELIKGQKTDITLSKIRALAMQGRSGYEEMDGILYRNFRSGDEEKDRSVQQLVLPKCYRKKVLEVAHDISMAGHLGREKTLSRILQRFFWPGITRDVKQYCRSCAACQKVSKKSKKAFLQPMPIIEEPFSRIAMDIVGPLDRSRSGNKYILVVCDYATRYPEAMPLKNIDAETVSEAIAEVFTRFGIPREILTDQGSNFMAELLNEVFRLLDISHIKTSPYHPQTDGLVERFNGTLKTMLRKFVEEHPNEWDKLLPYLLFAYREVPQESTGFSPFELLFGHHVRGPLDVMKESWEEREYVGEDVLTYIMNMRERLATMSELAHENLEKAQEKQKRWYDKKARNRELEEGQQVLVLLPSNQKKIHAAWQGPYKITKKVGTVDYEVDMHDKKKRRRIFHINMLKPWYTPENVTYSMTEVDNDEDDSAEDIQQPFEDSEEKLYINKELPAGQQEQMKELLDEYRDVLSSIPGKTELVKHKIEVGDAKPIRQRPYRLPWVHREAVKKELDMMLEHGIIEESSSEWAQPMVIVSKKDSSEVRLCIDFRKVNQVAKVDSYPLPRIEDLIDKMGQAKYITTMDLSRGYWQIPLTKDSKEKTAFVTPFGLWQFVTMPFGLADAQATCQRLVDTKLIRGIEDFAAAYVDDLTVFSATWEEHLLHLREMLKRLRCAGLTIKPKKCRFGMEETEYLGHIVGNGVVRPCSEKAEAVKRFPIPETKKQVRSFLGLAGYYRKFIKNFSELATPLTNLTKKREPQVVNWTEECDLAFRSLKEMLCQKPVLKAPDFTKEFKLQTDASEHGLGAVLSQKDEDGLEHPVVYISRKLLPRERNYATIEKECLAMKWSIESLRVYLLGKKFILQTDHNPLKWLGKMKDQNGGLSRWSLSLQPYSFDIEHRPGKENANADALSRL